MCAPGSASWLLLPWSRVVTLGWPSFLVASLQEKMAVENEERMAKLKGATSPLHVPSSTGVCVCSVVCFCMLACVYSPCTWYNVGRCALVGVCCVVPHAHDVRALDIYVWIFGLGCKTVLVCPLFLFA